MVRDPHRDNAPHPDQNQNGNISDHKSAETCGDWQVVRPRRQPTGVLGDGNKHAGRQACGMILLSASEGRGEKKKWRTVYVP
jgi:hypothetical protein